MGFGCERNVSYAVVGILLASNDDFSIFMISTWYLVNITTQSWLHSCPMEIRDPDLRLSKMCPTCPSWGSLAERGIVAQVEGSMLAPFATCTEGPVNVGWMSVQYFLAEGTKWWPVAPASAISDDKVWCLIGGTAEESKLCFNLDYNSVSHRHNQKKFKALTPCMF